MSDASRGGWSPIADQVLKSTGLQEALSRATAPVFASAARHAREIADLSGVFNTWSPIADQVLKSTGLQEALSRATAPVFATAARHAREIADLSGVFNTMRALFDRLIEQRQLMGRWFSELAGSFLQRRPATVSGVEESLASYRRRSIEADARAYGHLRALLMRRRRKRDAPGRLVTTHPQVTRGPNDRRLIRYTQSPAGFSRV